MTVARGALVLLVAVGVACGRMGFDAEDAGDGDAGALPDVGAPSECAAGDTRPCGVALGECVEGVEPCVEGAWAGCDGATVPGEESCNALDDDCDGMTDEGCGCVDGQSRPCGRNVGACRVGVETCADGAWGDCTAEGPSAERCDEIDNDCNGVVDEWCPCTSGTTLVCGTAVGACRTGIQTCRDGAWPLYCDGAFGPFEATGPLVEACDGTDYDCDGTPDDGCACKSGTTRRCGSDVGSCLEGTQVCVGGRLGVCDGAIGPAPEECDGDDDDCDGSIDEGCGS